MARMDRLMRLMDALRRLPDQPQPSQSVMPGLLDGFGTIRRQASLWLNEDGGDRPRVVTVAAD